MKKSNAVKKKGSKGQLTIEFLMILVIMLILFNAVSMDLANSSVSEAQRVQAGEAVKMATAVFNSTLEAFRFQGSGAKASISLRAPPDCEYRIFDSIISVYCSGDALSDLSGKVVAASSTAAFNCPQCPLVFGSRRIVSGNISVVTVTKS